MKDLTGKRFGRLVADRLQEIKDGVTRWHFICDCGGECIVASSNIGRSTKSCGCMKKVINVTHGMRHSRFYGIWGNMISRCKNNEYKNYGGRGIKCLWDSFEEFKNDMHVSYQIHCKEFGEKNTTIDRIDNDGNYCKENCRWATNDEQSNNKRNSHKLTFNGMTKTVSQWGIYLRIKPGTLYARIDSNWPIEKALTTPILKFKRTK